MQLTLPPDHWVDAQKVSMRSGFSLKPNQNHIAVAVVSHIQRIGCQPKTTTYDTIHGGIIPARGLLKRENRSKRGNLVGDPALPPTLLV